MSTPTITHQATLCANTSEPLNARTPQPDVLPAVTPAALEAEWAVIRTHKKTITIESRRPRQDTERYRHPPKEVGQNGKSYESETIPPIWLPIKTTYIHFFQKHFISVFDRKYHSTQCVKKL